MYQVPVGIIPTGIMLPCYHVIMVLCHRTPLSRGEFGRILLVGCAGCRWSAMAMHTHTRTLIACCTAEAGMAITYISKTWVTYCRSNASNRYARSKRPGTLFSAKTTPWGTRKRPTF